MASVHGLLGVAVLAGLTACAAPPRAASDLPSSSTPAPARTPTPAADERPARPGVVGRASWYGAYHHGRPTASGEIFDMRALTAAHRTLPLGTRLRVTNLENGKSVEVRVNDRGPMIEGRIIDLSRRAAEALDAVDDGVFPVELVVLD